MERFLSGPIKTIGNQWSGKMDDDEIIAEIDAIIAELMKMLPVSGKPN